VHQSGNRDLFIAYVVFIVPSVLLSAVAIGLKLGLLRRRVLDRKAKLRRASRHVSYRQQSASARRLSSSMDLALLCDRFVLHRKQQQHDESKAENDTSRYEAYSSLVLAMSEVLCSAYAPGWWGDPARCLA
jgi:signal transduction histidine kinase